MCRSVISLKMSKNHPPHIVRAEYKPVPKIKKKRSPCPHSNERETKSEMSILPPLANARACAYFRLTKLLKAAHIGPSGAPLLMSSQRRGGHRPITSPARHAMIGGLKTFLTAGPRAMLLSLLCKKQGKHVVLQPGA